MSPDVRIMRRSDIPDVTRMFETMVDHLHEGKDEAYRQFYKERYTRSRLEHRIDHRNSLYLVARSEGRPIGFVFGWVTEGVGNIHWLAVDVVHRRQGYGSLLMEKAMEEFERRGCYKVELYLYARLKYALDFFRKFGFEEEAYLEKDFFGEPIVLMAKRLLDVPAERTSRRIILVGEAGQGIRLMAQVLASVLAALGKEVALNVIYGASVRGDEPVRAELIYSDAKIEVPFIDRADFLLQLCRSGEPMFDAKRIIIEEMACMHIPSDAMHEGDERIPFTTLATVKFGSPLFVNMIALGTLLSYIDINIEMVNFEAELPPRFLKQNIEAIRYGYAYQDHYDGVH